MVSKRGGSGVVKTASRRSAAVLALAAAMAGAMVLGACSSQPDFRRARGADDLVIRDIEPIFRGLIGAETTMQGVSPRVISGVGLVVGLNGTGSGDVPTSVRVRLEDEMTRYGVGTTRGGPYRDVSPSDLIDSPNTAVVLVQAVIRSGLPEGASFDVRVSAWPNSSTTSLEGGRLYTTELRRGVPDPNAPDVPAIAEARGEVFINPFVSDDTLTPPTVGRVIGGGTITQSEPILLVLDNASHSRARQIVHAVNSSFGRSGRVDVAVGRDDSLIELTVPEAYTNDLESFLELVRFTRVSRANAQEWARRYAETMVERPDLAEDLSWALRGLGRVSIAALRPLYDHPDVAPRLAAIRAGAFLGDPTVRPHVERLVTEGPPAFRASAVGLLADLGPDPRATTFLRGLLSNEDPNIRVAAYETLRDLNDPLVIETSASDDFDIHLVPSERPTIYVTQQTRPLVVIFGRDLPIERPAFTKLWDGRLLLNAERGDRKVDVLYRRPRAIDARRAAIDPSVIDLIRVLSYDAKPGSIEPGFGMSYSDTVATLAAMVDSGAVSAAFFPEADRLRLALLQARDRGVTARPELAGETMEDVETLNEPPSDAELARIAEQAEQEANDLRSRIVRFPSLDGENSN